MKRTGAIFLFTTALLGILFFVTLFLSIRPDPDDMLISLDIREHSLFYALKTRYLQSSFRTTLLITEQLIYGWQNTALYPLTAFIFCALLFIFLVYMLYKLSTELFSLHKLNSYERLVWISFCITQATAIYFLCSSRIEIFAWVGAMGGHLVPVVFALWALWLIVKKEESRFDIPLLILAALAIAGGAEHTAAWVFLAGTISFFIFKKQLDPVRRRRSIIFLSALLVFCLCISTNPGMWNRSGEVNLLLQQSKDYDPGVFRLMFFQPYKLIGILLVLSGFLFLRNFFPQIKFPRINFSYIFIIGALSAAICAMAGYAAYRTFALGRIWFPFDVFVYLLTAAALIHGLNKKMTIPYAVVGSLAVFITGWHCLRHIPALWSFKQSYDNVVERIDQTKPGETVFVNDFSPPDLVNLVDLDPSPTNEMNQLYVRFYRPGANISIAKKP